MHAKWWAGVVCLLVLVSCAYAAGKSLTDQEKLERKAANWRLMNSWTNNKLVTPVTKEEDFLKKIIRSPRNYTLAILFISDRACVACDTVFQSFLDMAQQYEAQRGPNEPREIFFIRASMEPLYSLCMKMGLKTIPALFYSSPSDRTGFSRQQYQFLYYPFCQDDMSSWEMSKFLADNTPVKIEGFSEKNAIKYLLGGMAIGLGLVPFVVLFICSPRGKWTWFSFTLIIFFIVMAGIIGNLVHGNPWSQFDVWTGEHTYIQTNLQRQFQSEGYAAGILLLGSSLCFIGIVHVVPTLKRRLWRRVLFLILALLKVCALNTWMAMYCHKNESYPFKYYFDWFLLLEWARTATHDLTGFAL